MTVAAPGEGGDVMNEQTDIEWIECPVCDCEVEIASFSYTDGMCLDCVDAQERESGKDVDVDRDGAVEGEA